MKQAVKFLVMVAAVAVTTSVCVSTSFAGSYRMGSAGSHISSLDARYHGGGGGYHGGGYYGGHWGGGWGRGWGWGWGGWYYPYWGFSYAYAPYPYYYNGYYNGGYYYNGYYYPPSAYYYPPPTVYSSQSTYDYNSPPPSSATQSPQQQSVDRPLSPTAVDRDDNSSSPPPLPPPPPPPAGRDQSIAVADIKALAAAGLSDDVILSHIRNSQAVFHLTTAEIIDLKKSGVNEKVIDYMINTASERR